MSLFGGGVPSTPKQPPAPKSTEQATENAANAERIRLMRAMGRQQTILTDQSNAKGSTKNLMGG